MVLHITKCFWCMVLASWIHTIFFMCVHIYVSDYKQLCTLHFLLDSSLFIFTIVIHCFLFMYCTETFKWKHLWKYFLAFNCSVQIILSLLHTWLQRILHLFLCYSLFYSYFHLCPGFLRVWPFVEKWVFCCGALWLLCGGKKIGIDELLLINLRFGKIFNWYTFPVTRYFFFLCLSEFIEVNIKKTKLPHDFLSRSVSS